VRPSPPLNRKLQVRLFYGPAGGVGARRGGPGHDHAGTAPNLRSGDMLEPAPISCTSTPTDLLVVHIAEPSPPALPPSLGTNWAILSESEVRPPRSRCRAR
jgi:hypothetical protein